MEKEAKLLKWLNGKFHVSKVLLYVCDEEHFDDVPKVGQLRNKTTNKYLNNYSYIC